MRVRRVDFRFSFLGMSQILGAPKHGIGGIFEMCIGCASLEELAAQERYWGLYGFFEDTSETRRGSLAAEDAARLYGVPSALISVRLYHRASRADHGLVRLWCFTDAEARPSVAARLGSLRCKGARWGAQLTENVYNIVHHAEDAKEAGATIHWKGPHRSTIYKLDEPGQPGEPADPGAKAWAATSACVRECVFFQPLAVQNMYQRYEYSIPKYGRTDPDAKFAASQITHVGLISQGDYAEISFYEDTLGLLNTTDGKSKEFTYDDACEGDRDILGLDVPGDRFYTTNVDGPESSLNVREYVSGRLHILRYADDIPSDIPDLRGESRPGTRGPCNYTLRVGDIEAYHAKVRAAEGTTEVGTVMINEFGERSFSFVAPDGYYWTMVETV